MNEDFDFQPDVGPVAVWIFAGILGALAGCGIGYLISVKMGWL